MNKLKLTVLLMTGLATVPSFAESFTDYARVKSAVPEYERVNRPRQDCSTEYIYDGGRRAALPSQDRSYGGAVIGGIAGGVLGNQVGKGHGREAATAAGAVIGALIGDRMDNGGERIEQVYNDEPREVRRCRNIDNWESRVTGYRVTYEYAGQRYTTIMPHDPGNRMRVRVSVDPAE
ncbi:glycine zipper 2TM domain-containing protein [Chitinivorax sp. B]|uniref:glycine zipper 2TM domain-containing protein n=1 Tax=Chitinivorax sp. B TaxID=2502235 RepID=UPI0010F9CC94|nr:glycine zipper 2TM domain-containing protein [Chitinivorax sp. B]